MGWEYRKENRSIFICCADVKATSFIPYQLISSALERIPSQGAGWALLGSEIRRLTWPMCQSQVKAPGFSGSLTCNEALFIYDHMNYDLSMMTFPFEPNLEAVLWNICASKAWHSAALLVSGVPSLLSFVWTMVCVWCINWPSCCCCCVRIIRRHLINYCSPCFPPLFCFNC